MKGNPNPSPKTRFGAGNNANPAGKTSVQKKQEMKNAEKATALRGRMLDALIEQFDGMTPAQLSAEMDTQFLKMLKDAEDRGLGAPVQPVIDPGSEKTPQGMADFYAMNANATDE